jgi:predicted RNase H-like HicB family nuclease
MSRTGPSGAIRLVGQDFPSSTENGTTIGEMVREGIKRAQDKLIDLSMRNSMLNFKHSETSARHVRIADEQISILVEALSTGRSFNVVPVPPVEQIPRDEDTDEFRAALKAAKEIDSDWLAAEDARRAAGNRRRARDKAAERALRDRVRAQRGMPEWRVATDPKARAKELGIDPSYDLPSPHNEPPPRHLDDALQTLHFPDRLEPKLSNIYSAARALQEDAGLSALYCAVGFLEWYDPHDAPDPAFAPLLLLPINMEKRISQGDYVYSISGRDDDEATNAALREKLKQLSLELPEYDPENGIEDFFRRITESLVNRPRWKVRRFVTIGLFSFARQVMWADLDPSKWPDTARPEGHLLLGQIYGDVAGENAGATAPVYDVDLPEMEQQAPALITDADASQLSAVIDATSGKNLVIQGPPGTGKSQAITNIIANALWHGKTVLFVSEKMAALNVVKDRLDSMQLGRFCLEVHSAKASKSLVLKAIRERMDGNRPRSNSHEAESARNALQESRQRLSEYSALINSLAGDTGLTIHQILWADSARSDLPTTVPESVREFRLPNPLDTDRFKLGGYIAAGRALDDLVASMGVFADPARQPWRGVGNLNLTRFDRAKAVTLVDAWRARLDQLCNMVDALSAPGWTKPISIKDFEQVAAIALTVPDLAGEVSDTVLTRATEDDIATSLKRWAEVVLEADRTNASLLPLCDPQKMAAQCEPAASVITVARELDVAELSLRQLEVECRKAQAEAKSCVRTVQLISDVFATFAPGTERDFSARAEAMVTSFLLHAAALPIERLPLRLATLDDAAIDILTHAAATAAEARLAAEQAKFEDPATPHLMQSLPSSPELRRAANTLRSASLWQKLFGREWRAAKAVWRTTFPSTRKSAPAEISRRLVFAAAWKDGITQLETDQAAKRASGRYWRSAETPFDVLIAVAKWMKSVRNITPFEERGAKELRRVACEGSAEQFTQARDFAASAKQIDLLGTYKAAVSKRETIRGTAIRLVERSRRLTELYKQSVTLGLHPEQPLTVIPAALELFAKLEGLSREKASLSNVAEITFTLDAATDGDKAKSILASFDHIRILKSANLPSAVVAYLLSENCSGRTAEIKHTAAQVKNALDQERSASNAVEEMLQLRPNDWCGGPLREVPVEALRQKCQDASQSPDQLEKQIDLLGAELEADRLGLGDLLLQWTKAGRAYADVAWAVESAFYRSAAERLMRDHPILARHAGSTHEQVRTRFQQLDRDILELNRKMIAARLHERPIPAGRRAQSVRDYTDNEMLSHQTGLQQPRIALRRLFTNAGSAIRAYTPCVMMSPMSVAQYLEPGKHLFDLLVVDEASQMKPEDALGALMRCGQAVIVGDPQQLPPTDFFSVSNDGDGQDAQDGPEESILELGRRCWHPMRMLEVHYRSRHQSLIAYSNREFYDERLLIYPSPVVTDPDYGVSCRRIEGVYEVGQGRNRIEAETVVEEAVTLMRTRMHRSLGIVAINQAQRDLIEMLMDQRAASDPDVLAYKQKWEGNLEEFFVKNLENVQGDERDTILISTVYGRTDEGVFRQNFGPINRAYGHRRLNVLFTRAKRKLTVFTSLDIGQIVADGHSRGVRVLKEFLEYAQTGTISPGRRTGAEPDSDFERWFLSRLNAAGYDAHPQVGVAKYRIDIGIVHPDKPGNYILGLECDGATYHSSKSARDRDRLRQDVLEGLNWKIHRIWSTDWYRNPEREFKRLIQNIEALRLAQPNQKHQ